MINSVIRVTLHLWSSDKNDRHLFAATKQSNSCSHPHKIDTKCACVFQSLSNRK